ncbi:hypothetical protein FQR65_LT16493 [Abscondita terminalis]|nr:hypothetical protein FQR65_LT16493 [Abscondita terminalis]
MENMNFVPRDDFYVTNKNNSAHEDRYLPCEEEQPSKVTKDQAEKKMNDHDLTDKESPETVFDKAQVDENKAEFVNDSKFTSVAEKLQNLDASIEFKDALPLPMSKEELITSSSKLGSTSNIYLAEDFETSRSHRRRTNLSNIFPAGIMGCKDESAHKNFTRNFTTTRLLSTQENLERPCETSRISEIVKEMSQIQDVKEIKEMMEKGTKESKDSKEIKKQSQIREIKEVIELKKETEVKEDSIQDTRRQMIKRKDGNPLLGIGYEDSPPIFTTCKIPPGGFSHHLW